MLILDLSEQVILSKASPAAEASRTSVKQDWFSNIWRAFAFICNDTSWSFSITSGHHRGHDGDHQPTFKVLGDLLKCALANGEVTKSGGAHLVA